MGRVLIFLLGGVVAFVLAAGAALVVLAARIDARGEVERAVEAATGRDLTIAGDVHVAYFPTIGFHAKDVRLSNVAGGAAEALIHMDELQIGVAPRPLFDRELEVRRLVLVRPRLALEVDAAGKPNWVLAPKPGPKPAPSGSSQPPMREMRFADVRIQDGDIRYANAKTGSTYALEDVDLKADLPGLAKTLSVAGSATFKGERVDLEASAGSAQALIDAAVTPATLKLNGQRLAATFAGTVDAKTGALAGDLEASGPSLRGLSDWMGQPLGVGPGLNGFTVKGRLAVEPKRLKFENAALTLDSVSGRGDFVMESGGKVPFLGGRLELAALDLNPYLAPQASAAGAAPTVTIESVDVEAATGWSRAPVDLTGLKAVNATIDLTTGPLTIQKVKLDRARASILLLDGVLVATFGDMALYGGTGAGQIELDGRAPGMKLKQSLDLTGVSAHTLLKDAIGLTNLEGAGRLQVRLSGEGATQAAFMQALDGEVSFTLEGGALRGVNLGGVSRTIRDALAGEMVGPKARTPFKDFAASFRIVDGVAATKDLLVRANDADVSATGVIDVAGRRLDMRVTPRAESILSRVGLAKGAGIGVPFRVNGPWDKLTYNSDLLGRAKPEIDAAVAKVRAQPR